MKSKNLLKDSNAYYKDNYYYELFSKAEDAENKVSNYLIKLVKNKIVLDAGCGTGKFLPSIEPIAQQYIGIDLSKEQLKNAKNKSLKNNTQFINTNLSNINLKDNSIDIIISTWVLGTIIDLNERKMCLNELIRVLKPNGKIILVENDENSEFEIIRNRHLDNRTKEYNNWILSNNFITSNKIDTYFLFKSLNEAKLCFNTIYGSSIANKIKSNIINHKIIIFEYTKN